jgi:hypothetical protein
MIPPRARRAETGLALVMTMAAMLVISVIGAALVLATNADLMIAANAGASTDAFYAADAALERTIAELRSAPDFSSVLGGAFASAFLDGVPSGTRVLADGSSISLDEIVSLANCNKRSGCTEADMNAALRGRPWGARNPRWRLFSYGPLQIAGVADSAMAPYVVTLVADDPGETDADPMRDGAPGGVGANPGAGILFVRAEAFGRRRARRVVQGAVLRRDLAARARWEAMDPAVRGPMPNVLPILQVTSWEEIR